MASPTSLDAAGSQVASPTRPGSTVKQRRQQRQQEPDDHHHGGDPSPPSTAKRHSRISVAPSPGALQAAQERPGGERKGATIAPQALFLLLVVLGGVLGTVAVALLHGHARDDFDSRIVAWSSGAQQQEQQQQHRGWLQSVLHQARGGAARHRHRRSKRLAGSALELPTFFRSASSSSSSASSSALSTQQHPLRWLDRHHADRVLSEEQLELMLAQEAVAAGAVAAAHQGLDAGGSSSALLPSGWDSATYLALWPDLQQAGLTHQQASRRRPSPLAPQGDDVCSAEAAPHMCRHPSTSCAKLFPAPCPQAKEHYLLHGAAERRTFRPYPLLLRYTSCSGLINQHFSHIAGVALALALQAQLLILPPALARDSFANYYSTVAEHNQAGCGPAAARCCCCCTSLRRALRLPCLVIARPRGSLHAPAGGVERRARLGYLGHRAPARQPGR
jgi:hypothetical protein